ncbi:hypothetical protein GFD59_12985 [Salmonella enterica]|nr:hypothetical protein [Salmonella enterica]EDJ5493143.1 hypothetical protein [Salmonella enterica]EDR3804807.1 hypothetical protein [Salmonella enterica]EDZ6915274.1 hypothetical protein [Salmonella enterica]
MRYSFLSWLERALFLQSLAKHCTDCKTIQRLRSRTRRGLAVWFAQNFFCNYFKIQTAQAGAV